MGSKMFGALAGAAALWLSGQMAPALAGDHGCQHVECYRQVRQPDVYASVARPVVIEPGTTEVVRHGPVIYNRSARVEAVPGRFDVQHVRAMYGSYTRTVMVSPARTIYEHQPAVRKVVHRNVIIRPASYRWENTIDRHGRVTRCKIVVPAVTRNVAREVVIPGRSVTRVIPATFRQVSKPMLISPARNVHSYQPPVYHYVAEPMMVRPATRTVIRHAPVIGMKHSKVLVRRGGYAWAPVGRHH